MYKALWEVNRIQVLDFDGGISIWGGRFVIWSQSADYLVHCVTRPA